MKLVGNLIELTCMEQALVSLAANDRPPPELTVEAFVEWLLVPQPDNQTALSHGANVLLQETFCEALVTLAAAEPDRGAVWIASRHPGILAWCYTQGIRPLQAVTHLDPSRPAPGDIVVGVFRLSLAARLLERGVRCVNLTIDTGHHEHDYELTPAQLRRCGARLQLVESIELGPRPACLIPNPDVLCEKSQ